MFKKLNYTTFYELFYYYADLLFRVRSLKFYITTKLLKQLLQDNNVKVLFSFKIREMVHNIFPFCLHTWGVILDENNCVHHMFLLKKLRTLSSNFCTQKLKLQHQRAACEHFKNFCLRTHNIFSGLHIM